MISRKQANDHYEYYKERRKGTHYGGSRNGGDINFPGDWIKFIDMQSARFWMLATFIGGIILGALLL